MRVGFIGLGHMGGPMSANILAAGHDLIVHDARPDTAAGLLAGGATWAGTPRETGAGRDVVITMLPTPRHVADVLLGPDGLLDGLALTVVLPEVLSFSLPTSASRLAELSFALRAGATAAVAAVASLAEAVGMKYRLADFGVGTADFEVIAADALADEVLASAPLKPAAADITRILAAVA